MNKRINILLAIVGIMAALLLMTGCGDGKDVEDKALKPFVTAPKNGTTTNNTQGNTQAFTDATHILEGSLTQVNQNKFQLIAPKDYTKTLKSDPKITLTVKVDNKGLIIKDVIRIDGVDDIGSFKYEARCENNSNCGVLAVNSFRTTLSDPGGFISLFARTISNGTNISGEAKLDGISDADTLGIFNLTVKTVNPVQP